MKYLNKSVLEIHELLKEKKIKPIDLLEEAFANIEANKELNAYITLNKEEAIKQAKELSKIFKVSLDELLDTDIRDTVVEKVSNTEKLTNMAFKIVKVIGIAFLVMLIIDIITMIILLPKIV